MCVKFLLYLIFVQHAEINYLFLTETHKLFMRIRILILAKKKKKKKKNEFNIKLFKVLTSKV
jgi:hypothetical protein